jgi:hypothetical protein
VASRRREIEFARLHRRLEEGRRRTFALSVVGLVSATTIVSLARLVHYLVAGGRVGGERLIESGALLWLTLVLLFTVFYWEFERRRPGGPDAAPGPAGLPVPADGLGGARAAQLAPG